MYLRQGTYLQGGKYQIVSVLGQGGFGITYLAEQVLVKRKVCIKEFFPKEYYKRDDDSSAANLMSDGFAESMNRFKAKFIKEAQTIAALDHPNIIHIFEIFEENGTAYYVMEYVEGESLSDKVKRSGAMDEAEAIGYIHQIAEALGYIHSEQIMHLDVKPANVMVRSRDNRAILIDFGLAKHYDTASGEATSTTPVGVSHGFAPMEQYKEGGVSTFSPETDIYSLGATLYYLVTGTIPPQASDISEDGLPTLPSHLSVGVRRAITTAMQSRRKDRPHSIAEFLGLLDFVDNASEMDTYSECTIPDAVVSESAVADIKKPQPEPKWSLNNKHIELKNASTTSKRWFVWVIVALLAIGAGITLFTSNNKPTDEAKPSVSDENLVIMEAADEVAVESVSVSDENLVMMEAVDEVDEVAVESEYTTLTPPNNEIWYTTTNREVDRIHNPDTFDANIISNTYKNGKGVITFDGPVTTIGKMAFDEYDLKSVTIPDSVTTIGDYAFYNCHSLTSVTIPDSVTTIGDSAFYFCTSLTSITIPDSVTTIGMGAFFGCNSLKAFRGKFASNDGRCLIKDNTIIAYANASGTTYVIPDSVTTIGNSAFSICHSLTRVTIPDSVVSIGNNAFYGCESLTSVTIPNSVVSIGSNAFDGCSRLTSVTIPDSVTTIGNYAFRDCSSLTSVTIGNSVTTIGNLPFFGCESVKTVYCKITLPFDSDVISGLLAPFNDDCLFYVHKDFVETYKESNKRRHFTHYPNNIVGYDFEN